MAPAFWVIFRMNDRIPERCLDLSGSEASLSHEGDWQRGRVAVTLCYTSRSLGFESLLVIRELRSDISEDAKDT